jgi:hypothetical protein
MTEKEDWISAANAVALLKPFLSADLAQLEICKRAHVGLIRARAEWFMHDNKAANNVEVPSLFWWAAGHSVLKQDWTAGDFSTWSDRGTVHLQAFGVTFVRADIEKLLPQADATPVAEVVAPPAKGGQPPIGFWDDLWIEIFGRIYLGDFKPQTQADIEKAMSQWAIDQNQSAGETTIRDCARKLWNAYRRWEGKN